MRTPKTRGNYPMPNFSQALKRAVPLNEGDQWHNVKAAAKAHQAKMAPVA